MDRISIKTQNPKVGFSLKLTCKGSLRQMINRFYRLEIHSLVLVFFTHLVNCCLSYLLSDWTPPPPPQFLSASHHGKYKGGGLSLIELRNVSSYFFNKDWLKYNFHSQFYYAICTCLFWTSYQKLLTSYHPKKTADRYRLQKGKFRIGVYQFIRPCQGER